MLEGGRGVGETKEHDSRFKEAFVGNKSSLPLVSILDMDIVIFPLYIKFGKDSGRDSQELGELWCNEVTKVKGWLGLDTDDSRWREGTMLYCADQE